MKNTPEVQRMFDQMSEIAEHLTSGYRIETTRYCEGEYVSLRIRKPADTEWAVYPEIYFSDDWYGIESVRFGIATTGYGDHSMKQAQRALHGLECAIELVKVLTATAEASGLTVHR